MIGELYYRIWVRMIYANKDKNWKPVLFPLLSCIFGMNISIIFIWMNLFGIIDFDFIEISFSSWDGLNKFVSFYIQFAGLPSIVNYFLIFHNNRYELLLKKYKSYTLEAKIPLVYIMIVVFGTFLSGVCHGMFG